MIFLLLFVLVRDVCLFTLGGNSSAARHIGHISHSLFVHLSVLSLSANRLRKTKRIKYLLSSLSWIQSKMAEICGGGFSLCCHIYESKTKHNAEETALLTKWNIKKNNPNAFREVFFWVASQQLWEHNISQCVAFCFVSTKAAVHRKSLDSVWTAALPTESGTEPGERRAEPVAVKHYVPRLSTHNNNVHRPVTPFSPHCPVLQTQEAYGEVNSYICRSF